MGNLRIHNSANIGFHSNLINNGSFNQNEGLVGFYADDATITVSGAFIPIFKDMEVAVDQGLFLETTIGLTNNLNLVSGNIVSSKTSSDISLNFKSNAFYVGGNTNSKIDGFASISDKKSFIFPVGDEDHMRPLELTSEENNNFAACSYFFEDPNAPSFFTDTFNTNTVTSILSNISTNEFWVLEGSKSSKIKLSWDSESELINFADDIKNIRVVGWNTTLKIWSDLGNTAITGDLYSGSIASDTFVPDDYTILTIGSRLNSEDISLANILVSPDNDGINDYFYIDALSSSPNNQINIYNRWGRLVYSKENYQNSFKGVSNVNNVISKDKRLPGGVYIYIINLYDINVVHQGYLYLKL